MPEPIHRVAVETAPEMIVHAADGHFSEGEHRQLEGPVTDRSAGGPDAQQKNKGYRTRKFRGVSEPAKLRIKDPRELIATIL